MRVLFAATGDESQASTRLRISNLIEPLDASGIDSKCLFRGWFYRRLLPDLLGKTLFLIVLLFRSPFYDVVYLHRITPRPLAIRALRILAHDIVFDFDDAIYTDAKWVKRQNNDRKRRRTNEMLAVADAVVAGSPSLAKYARENGISKDASLLTLPTPLDRNRYAAARGTRVPSEKVRIGWIGYPDNLRYLATAEDALADVLDSFTNSELMIITAGEISTKPLIERSDVTYLTWSIDAELELLSSADIGIRPLADTEWTRNKGGYTSVVQCMALGMPVVITPVGYLKSLVKDGVTGFHANTHNEWVSSLSTLIKDSDERVRMGTNAKNRLEEEGLWLDQYTEQITKMLVEFEEEC